jgi:hypothetical protein
LKTDSKCYVQIQQILQDLFSSADIVQLVLLIKTISEGHMARMGDRRGAYRAVAGNPEGKRLFGRPRRGWEDIRMDIKELGWGHGLNDLGQNRDKWRSLVNAVMNFRVV